MTLDEFFAEAKRLNLKASDLVPQLAIRPEFADCLPDDFKEAKATIMAMPEQELRALAVAQYIQLRIHEKHGNTMANLNAAYRAEQAAHGVKGLRLLTNDEVMAIINAAPPPTMPNTFAAIQAKFCEVNGLPVPDGVGVGAPEWLPGDDQLLAGLEGHYQESDGITVPIASELVLALIARFRAARTTGVAPNRDDDPSGGVDASLVANVAGILERAGETPDDAHRMAEESVARTAGVGGRHE